MALRVVKFGGTSVETPERILAVARRIRAFREAREDVIVVVSAMGQQTDELLALARRVSSNPSRRELDMLLTAGERISMALLAMALESMGCSAISFTGSQSGILTDESHFGARIRTIRAARIEQALADGKVAIVAGFQGVSSAKEITTLGRGGSDTTAVALAIRFGAERCEIYTDVAGVLSTDPRVIAGAKRIERIDPAAMIALSHLGGRVLYRRAAILARRFAQPVEVRSSLDPGHGTRIESAAAARRPFREEDGPMEQERVLAVAQESPVTWLRIWREGPPETPPPADSGRREVSVLLASSVSLPGGSTLEQWIAAPEELPEGWLTPDAWGAGARVEIEREVALVSLVGDGTMVAADLIGRARACLEQARIPVLLLHSGSLSLSFLVPEARSKDATKALHAELIERVG